MKVRPLILTEGGGKKGFGHIARCISLSDAFKEKRILPKLVLNAEDDFKGLLKDKNCQIFDWLKDNDKLFKIAASAEIIVIDSYLADSSFYERISRLVKIPVYIDDTRRLDYPKGIVVNGLIYAEKIKYPKNRKNMYLLGSKFVSLRKEFWDIPERIPNNEIKNILITFGGIGNFDLVNSLAVYLKDKFPYSIKVVANKKIKIADREMFNLMANSDICISGGGQTTYELARCGVPTIGICFADNQKVNLENLSKAGFLRFAGWYNDKNLFKRIEAIVKSLMDYKKRLKMYRAGRKYIDGQGARRVVDKIIQHYKQRV